MNNILILGNGYIGGELKRYFDIFSIQSSIISKSDLDYTNGKSLYKFLKNSDFTHVINTFGFTGRPNVDEAEFKKEECWFLNVVAPKMVSEVCDKAKVKYVHISSGCIYSGYDKEYTENDTPNFGLYNVSSFYSKSKHGFETITKDIPMKLLRIRMPICNNLNSPRNYLSKIMKYPNLIDFKNSKTYIPDLCGFIVELLKNEDVEFWSIPQDIYNVVNPYPLSTKQTIQLLNRVNEGNWDVLNPNWVNVEDLNMAAPRSNCVLDNTKASKIYKFKSEVDFMMDICRYNNEQRR